MLRSKGNTIFLISARGISGDLSTNYDMRYLEDSLLDDSGQSSLRVMDEGEIALCEEIRALREENRNITVKFFNESQTSFPNVRTQEVVNRFEKLVLESFISFLREEGVWLSKYKVQELKRFIYFLFYLFEDDSVQETIAFTQSLRWIKKLINYRKNLHSTDFSFEASKEHPDMYYVRVQHNKYQSNLCIKLVLYKASFNNDYYVKSTQKTYLDELVEEEGQKIFFISAYQTATKGLNPIIKTSSGAEKDFDSLILLMDSYYTVMKPSLKSKNAESEESLAHHHFALMKNIVRFGDSNLEIKDFNKYLSEPEARAFQEQQHQILLGKGVLQAIGRAERRDFPNQTVKIFINEETQRKIVKFFRYLEREESDEIRKFSVNNYKVYSRVKEEEAKLAIRDYDEHTYNEIEAYQDFQSFRKRMLDELDNFRQNGEAIAIIKAWRALRDPVAFKDPNKYLEKLRELNLFPPSFIESLFYQNLEQSKFIPYLALEEEDGKKFCIISDSIHGDRDFPYRERLYPESFKMNSRIDNREDNEVTLREPSADSIYKIYNKLIPQPEIFDTFIPRPRFFYDVLYPSLTESFAERWIQDVIFKGKDWETIKNSYGFEPLLDFSKYNKLFEQFDLYYMRGNTLLCIDVKGWSRASGICLSHETVNKAQQKLDAMVKDYPEFTSVRGLLLNLRESQEKNQQHSSTLFSGNLLYLDNYNNLIASTVLKDFLFQNEK